MKLEKMLQKSFLIGALLTSFPLSADITGTVYQELPVNGSSTAIYGQKDSNEIGLSGITVTGIDESGTTATVLTSADGTYTLSGLTGKTRIIFKGWPSYLKEGFDGKYKNTSVRFVQDGDTNINFGLHAVQDYCQSNPDIVSIVHNNGDNNGQYPTLVQFNYTDSGKSGDGVNTSLTTLSDNSIGAIWGIAYARQEKKVYSSAFLKRHVSLGNDGLGAIYVTDTTQGSANASLFVTIPDVGTTPTDSDRDLEGKQRGDANHDNPAYPDIGKIGLGDIELSDNEKYLYTVNLNNKHLYKIEISSQDITDIGEIPDPGCTNGYWRPFALSYYHDSIYVGGVCDAANGGSKSDLSATVYRYDSNTFSSILTVPLDYDKVSLWQEDKSSSDGDYDDVSFWHPWIDTSSDKGSYVQPVLSDIDFDIDGSMILAFFDRWGHQVGQKNYIYNTDDFNTGVVAGGDILRACPDSDGTFILESGGICGGVTGAVTDHNSGPGNGEFYNDRFHQDSDTKGHGETSSGSLALLAGSGELILNVMDPLDYFGGDSDQDYFRSGGPAWFNNSGDDAGKKTKGLQLFRDADNDTIAFAKGTGVGDIELLCPPSPVEIGNRIWKDENRNGIQDASEIGIEGVTVQLYKDDTLLAEVNTSTEGIYLFSSDATASSDTQHGYAYGIITLTPETSYTIKIPNIDGASQQEALTDLKLTENNVNSDANDTVDSDCAVNDGDDSNAWIDIDSSSIGMIGDNNHTFDCGFYEVTVDIDIEKYTNNVQADLESEAILLEKNDSITWTYVVKNTGNELLKNIVVSDDQNITVTCPTTTLDIGEEMNCTASGTATIAEYENKGTVTAEGNNSGEEVSDEDLSHYKLYGSWSGNVSKDIDNDDNGDEPLENVALELFSDPNCDGDKADGVSHGTTNTDIDGNYSFSSLEPGCYVVVESQPIDLLDVREFEGGTGDGDDQGNGVDNNEISGMVDAGETDSGNDFVEEEPGNLCGNVSKDTNNYRRGKP